MSKQPQGFILILVLSLISILSLLFLSTMQHLLMYFIALNKQEKQQQDFYKLEEAASYVSKLPFVQGPCLGSKTQKNQNVQKKLLKKSCLLTYKTLKYSYFIEDLGLFPCLVTAKENKLLSTHHYRISITLLLENQEEPVLLQQRLIHEAKKLYCKNTSHIVPVGISSWRYLLDFTQNLSI